MHASNICNCTWSFDITCWWRQGKILRTWKSLFSYILSSLSFFFSDQYILPSSKPLPLFTHTHYSFYTTPPAFSLAHTSTQTLTLTLTLSHKRSLPCSFSLVDILPHGSIIHQPNPSSWRRWPRRRQHRSDHARYRCWLRRDRDFRPHWAASPATTHNYPTTTTTSSIHSHSPLAFSSSSTFYYRTGELSDIAYAWPWSCHVVLGVCSLSCVPVSVVATSAG